MKVTVLDAMPREASDAKQRVKVAALKLFSRDGFASVSVRDIMTECGLTGGALYAHYKSKEEVLYSLIKEGHERLNVRLKALFEFAGTPAERLARLSYVHMLFQLRNLELARVSVTDFRYLPEGMRNELEKFRDEMAGHFDLTLKQGMSEGVFDAQMPISPRMMILSGANFAPQWYRPEGKRSPEEIAAAHADMVLRICMATGPAALGVRSTVTTSLKALEGGWEQLQAKLREQKKASKRK